MADKKTTEPRRALGRGLEALLPVATESATQRAESEFQRVPVEALRPNKNQPRKRFREEDLEELSQSLQQQGMLQPIVVRKLEDGVYEIVAGERRWRAAQRASLREVPIIIKELTPSATFELALVENLQRTDLDPLETAEAYQRLIEEHGYTQETLAARLGKSRSAVTNTLRLLQLPSAIREQVVSGQLAEGHARTLLSVRDEDEMARLARDAAEKNWSVRELEAAVKKATKPAAPTPPKPEPPPAPKNANVRDLEKRLASVLGMNVVIRDDPESHSGVVEFAYDNLDQLDRLVDKLLG